VKKQRVSKHLYYYTPKQYEEDIRLNITFSALSHKELTALEQFIETNQSNEFSYQSCKLAISSIEDNFGNELTLSDLTSPLINEIGEVILEYSSITNSDYEKLETSVNISLDNTFKSESWKCSVCKAKRLDKIRNCGFLGEKEKSKDFKVYLSNQVYTYCPIYDVDAELLNSAIDCYSMYDKGMYPDSGGLYDQTRFFIISSQLMANKIRDMELKEAKKNSKK